MNKHSATLEQMLRLAKQLTPLEKVQLLEKVVPDLEAPLKAATTPKRPLQSAYGLCADLGTAPSAQDIDAVRQEVFKEFPRENN